MKAGKLAEILMKEPDYDVVFEFSETSTYTVSEWGVDERRFTDVTIEDIGHSSNIIILGGTEQR